ncbi:trypsin-like serine protease [Dyella sp.]|uniref:trypsin-like serine peptidase n=1 Tax=Dyella sp. TaxID=1869338 RepID=UPI002FD9E6AF
MHKAYLALFVAAASATALHVRAETLADAPNPRADTPYEVVPSPPCREKEMVCRDKVIDFWTSEKMKAAWPAEDFLPPQYPIEPVLDPDADQAGYTLVHAPYMDRPLSRFTGILFWRSHDPLVGEELRHCSASVIHSSSQNLILTAAHCLYGIKWHDMLMFVPAFDGTYDAPLGKWPIRIAFMPGMDAPGNPQADIAVARVYSQSSGETLEKTVGGALQPLVNSGELFPLVRDVGYPSKAISGDGPYHFAEQRQCDSHTDRGGQYNNLVLLNCSPQPGNSGGPIVAIYSAPVEVVGVFAKTTPISGQPRLLPETFVPMYKIADSLSPE